MTTIRFARLSFEKKLTHFTDERSAIERRKATLRDVIDFSTDVNFLLRDTDMRSKRDKGQWYFGDVVEGEDYISARLGKQTEELGKKPDEEIEGFREYERDDTIVSHFVIDVQNSVMAYEYRRDIGDKAPYRILRAVYNAYHQGEEELTVSPLVDKEEVRLEISQMAKITRVRFVGLKPPNPNSTDRSRPMDEFLEDSGIDKLLLDGESDGDENDEGINLAGDPLLDGGMNLAEEGYGSATVIGEDEDGEERRVTTDEKPIESEVDMDEEDVADTQTLLAEIREALYRLEE